MKNEKEILTLNNAVKDFSKLNDQELDRYIDDLIYTCQEDLNRFTGINPEINLQILQAIIVEKHSRNAEKQILASNTLAKKTVELTKKTIILWWIAIFLAVISILITILK